MAASRNSLSSENTYKRKTEKYIVINAFLAISHFFRALHMNSFFRYSMQIISIIPWHILKLQFYYLWLQLFYKSDLELPRRWTSMNMAWSMYKVLTNHTCLVTP
eukprot:TRINITY_DN40805_c0_g1_i1.p1 TRINITY_DN40805_c0_g1~~TRINITY_DN40805_c0_g1_i1.p1  ORF type:complete len:113 (+),score=4.94 TRINITY_DN40805_c0_g1_i1:30-341(+)